MAPLLRRPTNVSCFFCNSPITPLPQNPRNFRCPHCSCFNRYDANGEILSDEPAMHEEALNARSFAKRASPSKDRLPTVYSKGPFCHACTTNQMLLTNLLANYLPPATSPEYERRLEMLPDYKQSLYTRYPPVCASCAPAVEEELRNKEHMARTSALGGWLKESRGKGKQRQTTAIVDETAKVKKQLTFWRIRGCLWVATLASAVAGNLAGAFGYGLPPMFSFVRLVLPGLVLVSILWTAWDPTYRTLRTAQRQGRSVRVEGKRHYNILQAIAYLSRLFTTIVIFSSWFRPSLDYLKLFHDPPSLRSRIYFTGCLILELLVFICSCAVLRLNRPAPVRLVDTNTHKHSSVPPQPELFKTLPTVPEPTTEPDLLASLTLSSKPVMTNPIFGLPSLINPRSAPPDPLFAAGPSTPRQDTDEDAMDWTPTDPSAPRPRKKQEPRATDEDADGSWLRPQRFFPPEQPTGLESLFPRIQLAEEAQASASTRQRGGKKLWWSSWWWLCALSLVPLAGVGYKLWYNMRYRRVVPPELEPHDFLLYENS